jgi:hypothetical protein
MSFWYFQFSQKMNEKNSTLQLWYLKSNCLRSFFLGSEDTKQEVNRPLVQLQKLNLKTTSNIFFDMIDGSSGSPTCLKFDHISIRRGSLWTHVLSAKVSPNVCSTMPSWPSRDKNVPKMTLSPLWRFSHRAAVICKTGKNTVLPKPTRYTWETLTYFSFTCTHLLQYILVYWYNESAL